MKSAAKLDSFQALEKVREEIKTISDKPKNKPPVKKYEGKFPLKYIGEEGNKFPIINTGIATITYPTKRETIHLPKGCVRASYNSELKQVEYFGRGSKEPIHVVKDSYHVPLPIPSYFSELESVEEVLDLDLETGEILCEIKYDLLDDMTHWMLRLSEYKNQLLSKNVPQSIINKRLEWYAKLLKEQRGIDIKDKNFRIAQNVLDAISFIEKKQFFTR